MVCLRILAIVGWTVLQMLILPLMAIAAICNIAVSDALLPMAKQMQTLRENAANESTDLWVKGTQQ